MDPSKARPTRSRRLRVAPYAFIAPFFVLYLVFTVLPLLMAGAISLAAWKGLRPTGFVGPQNFVRLLGDPTFFHALTNTVIIWLQVPLTIGLALLLAVVINSRLVRARSLSRSLLFLPVILSLVVSGLAFALLLDPEFGLVNTALGAIGFPKVAWLTDEAWTKPSLILLTLWRWTGYYMIIMLAGINSIDPDLTDAVHVDGGSAWQEFRHLTLPLIKPFILFAVILATVGSFGQFEQIYVMFGPSGGVAQSALSTALLVYREAFVFGDFGYASAMSYAVGLILLAAVVLLFRMFSSDVTVE